MEKIIKLKEEIYKIELQILLTIDILIKKIYLMTQNYKLFFYKKNNKNERNRRNT